jgi:hypothetical protein
VKQHSVIPSKRNAWRNLRQILFVGVPVFLFAVVFFAYFVANAAAIEEAGNPTLRDATAVQVASGAQPVTPGISPPVWSLPEAEPREPGAPPVEVNPRQRPGFVPQEGVSGGTAPRIYGTNSTRTPQPLLSFDGMTLDNAGSGYPPDTVGDVGPNHYMQMVNSSFAIWTKTGTPLQGPTNINSLWTDGTLCQTQNQGDPIVLYDRQADRWLMTQFNWDVDQGGNDIPPYFQCIAISQTPDPMGAWYTYSFNTGRPTLNDYGKMAVWPDGYYMGANEDGFTAYVFDRVNMLAGAPARPMQLFNVPGQNMMLPSDLDGATPPPAVAPNYFYTMLPGNRIQVWALSINWNAPANSSFTQIADLTSTGFIYDVCPADPFNDDSLDCISQPNTNTALDAIGEWPMFRLQYRNHGTYESLVGNFTVDTNAAAGVDHAAPHWFELRKVGAGNWTLYQEGTIAPDGSERWLGSAASDKDGNIAVGYSVSAANAVFPSIRYATRLATDPLGTMGAEVTLHAGTTSQDGVDRWGDYSAMSVDPSDDCTFWYTNEYVGANGNWRTRIGAFKIPACGSGQPPAGMSLRKAVAPAGQVQFGDTLTYTVAITATPGTQLTFFDPLQGTVFERFVSQPAGIVHSNGTITGSLTVTPTQNAVVAFVVRVNAPGTIGFTAPVTNRACILPFGGTLGGCVWSNEVSNASTRPYQIYLPFVTVAR